MALRFVPDTDDRITCSTCANIGAFGPCMAARRGEIMASQSYEPDREQRHRCLAYRPGQADPDKRSARARWPGLSEAIQKSISGQKQRV